VGKRRLSLDSLGRGICIRCKRRLQVDRLDALLSQGVVRGIRTFEDLFHSFFCGLITLDQIQVKSQNNHAQREQLG